MRGLVRALQAREASWLESRPAPIKDALRRAGRPGSPGGDRWVTRVTGPPYWMVLISALCPNRHRGLRLDSFINDVLWGQYCLFLFVRIQDDVFDRQEPAREMLFVADQFMVEAERAFAAHLSEQSRFWPMFRDALERTTRAILHVDAMQHRAAGAPDDLLAGYADVGAVLAVGCAAVLLRSGRWRELTLLARGADEMAIASQIIDDLEDVPEDLGRGRFNYVAKLLLAGTAADQRSTRAATSAAIARTLVSSDGFARVIAEASSHLRRAREALLGLHCRAGVDYLTRWQAALCRLDAAIHRARVESVLGRSLDADRHGRRNACPPRRYGRVRR